jgi:hypothetical protein
LLPERKWRLAVWWGNTNMRLAHHLQRHPSGVWHFRMTVPRDLRALLGLRYIKKSLRTRDPMWARLGAYTLSAHYAQIFARIRRMGAGMAKDSDGKQNRQRPRPFLLRTGDGNEVVDYACKINADGSVSIEATGPEDHALAMEAWAEMTKTPPPLPTHAAHTLDQNGSFASVMETLGASLAQSLPTPPVSSVPSRPRPIGAAAEQWLKSIKADTLKKTLVIKTAAVMGFARHVGIKKMLHEVRSEDVSAWVEALRSSGLQTPTLVNKCSYLRGFFT